MGILELILLPTRKFLCLSDYLVCIIITIHKVTKLIDQSAIKQFGELKKI